MGRTQFAAIALGFISLANRAHAASEAPSSSAAPRDAPSTASPSVETSTESRLRALEDELRAVRALLGSPTHDTASASSPPPTPPSTAPAAPSTEFQPAVTPFAFGDLSWSPASYAPADSPLHYGPFTGEIRLDVPYHYELADPIDHTVSGSSEVFRHNEFQVTQVGFGGDFYYRGMQMRLMTQFGMYSQTTPRNDASPSRGQWQLDNAYRYISEAYAGYHINVLAGINIQAGIFMSYVGLWSYYNFDNWTYQPSYVSSNTPWFFNGVRIQIYPSERLKIEPWLVNGWQAYGMFNNAPGVGLQVRWNPTEWFSVLGNQYVGTDTLGVPGRFRIHTDDSVMVRLYDDRRAHAIFSRAAASFTFDAGCEFGPGVESAGVPSLRCDTRQVDQYFVGFMAYARVWFYANMFGLTLGGGAISNPGRYLVLLPPINGATAASGTPYFTTNKGDRFDAWDVQATLDFMPTRNVTFRLEYTHRSSDVPYFTGHGGVTPPGGNQGSPGSSVMGWAPDLVNFEDRFTAALMTRL